MAIQSLISDEEKKSLAEGSTISPVITAGRGDVTYRRNQEQLKKYNEMKELEKNQEALSRIQTKDFQDVLKRYYKNRPQFLKDGTFLENKHGNEISQ